MRVDIYNSKNKYDLIVADPPWKQAKGGKKKVRLPAVCRVRPVFGADGDEQITDTLSFTLGEKGTALFAVEIVR